MDTVNHIKLVSSLEASSASAEPEAEAGDSGATGATGATGAQRPAACGPTVGHGGQQRGRDAIAADAQRIERTAAAAVLRALLLSIFFQRTLENVVPETLDVFDTHVAVVGGASGAGAGTGVGGERAGKVSEVEREINDKVEGFVRSFVDSGKDGGEIAVVFLQRKNRKGWFAVTEALVPWEEHLVSVTFVTRATTTRNALNAALFQTLAFCSERRASVPALVGNQDQTNLSYQILLSPPAPAELFPPSPPSGPQRLTSPPPQPSLTVSANTAVADRAEVGYLGQAKDILALGLGVVRKGEF